MKIGSLRLSLNKIFSSLVKADEADQTAEVDIGGSTVSDTFAEGDCLTLPLYYAGGSQ